MFVWQLVLVFGPDRNVSTAIGWIAMKVSTDVHNV